MAIELITGYAGEGHVSSADVGRFNAGVCGTGKYVLDTGTKFAYTIESNNLVRIGSGDAVNQGRHILIHQNTVEEATIQNGSQGMTRIDVIALRYSKDGTTGVESASIVVIRGAEVASGNTPAAPAVTSGNIFNGDSVDDMPLYHVLLDGIQIQSVTKVFTEIPSLATMANLIYPVGSIYMSVLNTSPAVLFGGTWEKIEGRFLIGTSTGRAAGSTGGSETVTLTTEQIPSHTHTGPSHTHTFTTGNNSASHTHGTGVANKYFTINRLLSTASVGRRKVATGSSCYAMTATGDIEDITERSATGTQSANHTHSGTTAANGTGATGATGGGAAHDNMPPYYAVFIWKRTA